MASSDIPGGSPTGTPNRLLAASRVVHQLWRTQDNKIDLNRLLGDEDFAKKLMRSARVYADPKTGAMLDAFERASIETGAWRTSDVQVKPSYKTNADGSISAAAAWDPDFVAPAASEDAKPETEYIPTTSPRTSITVKERGNSSFISRFGFSRPADAGEAGHSVRNLSRGAAPASRSAGPSSQNPAPESPDGPIDPNHKKYIRGAR